MLQFAAINDELVFVALLSVGRWPVAFRFLGTTISRFVGDPVTAFVVERTEIIRLVVPFLGVAFLARLVGERRALAVGV